MKKVVVCLVAIVALCLSGPAWASAEEEMRALMAEMNEKLERQGAAYRVEVAEYLTAANEIGRTVFFRDIGNKQLEWDYVAGDDRRIPWSGTSPDIVYAVDQADPASTMPLAATTAAIDRAMGTWQAQRCSNIPISRFPGFPGMDLGTLLGGGLAGDINHAGWFPIVPIDILGVTFTFLFCDPCDDPDPVFTDVDGNGKLDTAFTEIYYNDLWVWSDDGSAIDVETIALHEAGHGLSQAHFGTLFRTDKNGRFHFSPRALMNAGYTGGTQRRLRGSDRAGHCSLWASWPQK